MKYPVLNAEGRTILGKKVKKLRRDGLLPANVYGKGLASKALQLKLSDFQEVFRQVGETGLVELKADGQTHPVLIKNLQIDYSTDTPIHADFYQVNLKEKIKTMVPVKLAGVARAVAEKLGVLLQTLSEVEVEALPDRIPENIEANVESLAKLGDGITVGDLKTGEGVAILTDPGVTIARIAELAKEEVVVVKEEIPAEGEVAAKAETGAKSAAAEPTPEAKPAEKPQEKQEKK